MGGVAYVVMCHTDGPGLAQRVRRLRRLSPQAHVLLRWAGPDLLDAEAVADLGVQVLRSSTEVRWGDWTLSAAALEAVETARLLWDPDHTVLVSGQDHPVTDLAEWERRLDEEAVDALLRRDPRDYDVRWRRCWHRLPGPLRLHTLLARLTRRGPWPARVQVAGGRTGVLHHARRGPAPLPYVKGSFWCTLSRAAVAAVLTAAADPEIGGWFATTLLPDEAFVHSVLAGHPELSVVAGPTSFTVFTHAADPHPRDLTPQDAQDAVDSGAPFARKVVGRDNAFAQRVDALVDDRVRSGLRRRA